MAQPKFVKYINLSVQNDYYPTSDTFTASQTENMKDAVIEVDFRQPIVKNANKYSLAIERMELCSNSVYSYPARDLPDRDVPLAQHTLVDVLGMTPAQNNIMNHAIGDWEIAIGELHDNGDNGGAGFDANLADPLNPGGIVARRLLYGRTISDVLHEINEFNNMLDVARLPGTAAQPGFQQAPLLRAYLDKSGRFKIYFNRFPLYYIVMGPSLAQVVGMPRILIHWQAGDVWTHSATSNTFTGEVGSLDRSIRTRSIIIESDLPLISDLVGIDLATVMTDFAFPSSYNMSVDTLDQTTNFAFDNSKVNLSYSPPQVIIYEPSVKRFLEFLTPVEIVRIRIRAWQVGYDGKRLLWKLAPGEFFNIKLGLYLK